MNLLLYPIILVSCNTHHQNAFNNSNTDQKTRNYTYIFLKRFLPMQIIAWKIKHWQKIIVQQFIFKQRQHKFTSPLPNTWAIQHNQIISFISTIFELSLQKDLSSIWAGLAGNLRECDILGILSIHLKQLSLQIKLQTQSEDYLMKLNYAQSE